MIRNNSFSLEIIPYFFIFARKKQKKIITMKVNEKHLEFIQGVISRHNSNSFVIKGWTITLTTAVFALTSTIDKPILCFIAIPPIIIFWFLDSVFLANERCFVSLYSCVANKNKLRVNKNKLKDEIQKELVEKSKEEKEYVIGNFSMNFIQFRDIKRNNWTSTFFSNTISWFYLSLTILTVLIFFILKNIDNGKEIVPLKIDANIKTMERIKLEPINIKSKNISLDTIVVKQIINKKTKK